MSLAVPEQVRRAGSSGPGERRRPHHGPRTRRPAAPAADGAGQRRPRGDGLHGLWTQVIGAVAARHGHAWTPGDWAAIQGTRNWGAYLAHRRPGLTPESAVAERVEGMVSAVEFGRFGLLASDLAQQLRTIVTGDDVAHGKPAPDPHLLAAHHHATDARIATKALPSLLGARPELIGANRCAARQDQ